jgi:hypothetical protein
VGTANPEELLGAGAHTSLAAAMAQATGIAVVLLAALTFGPYYLWSNPGTTPVAQPAPAHEEPGKAAPAPVASPATPAAPVTPDKPRPVAEANKPAPADKNAPVSKEAVDKLGVNDTKKADPAVNPLEKGTDDLLKELEKK